MGDLPGSGDCEVRTETWGQAVLLATSWAYVIAGIALLVWMSRRTDVARGWGWLYGIGLVFTGLGSVDYHGPALTPQPLTHDGGLALALLVALGTDLTRLTGSSRAGGVAVAAAAGLGGVTMALVGTASPVLAALIGAALVVCEWLIYHRGLRTLTWTQYVAVACVGVGGIVYALSRTGGPLCAPDSLLQGHGLWHILTAVALALWGVGALPGTAAATSGRSAPPGAQQEHTWENTR